MTSEREEPRQLQAEGLFAAWASRVEAGDELDFEELVRANAQLEPELRALHEDWKHFAPILGNVVPGLIASGDGLVLPSLTRGPDVDEGPPSDELLEKLGLQAPDTKRYRFRGRIGTGGQGVVLKVWDAKLSRPLAMKIVLGRAEDQPTGQTPRVDGRRLTRFVDEARIASQLNHPGIVPVHELGADESGRAFFTMKLVKGDDLSRIFDKAKRGEDGIGLPRAVSYLLRVCEAMAYAHDRGVIHRDLKPANVMVGAYGEVHVMDWGLARVIGDGASDVSAPRARATEPISQVDSVRRAERSLSPDSPLNTEHGHGLGTPCYMSPEQARGDPAAVGPASDIYAVGAMLYQLLTGTPPYLRPGERRSPEFIAIATVEGPPPPVEKLAPRAIPELVAICEHAMARDPAARYASMRALAADLQAFLDGRVVGAYETGAWAETRKWVKRNRALTGALAATVLVSAAGASGALWLAREARANELDAVESQRRLKAETARANELASEAQRTAVEASRQSYVASILGAAAALQADEPAACRQLLDSAPAESRNFEWRYLDAIADDSWRVLRGHKGTVSVAEFSPDGDLIATAGHDGSVRLWNAASGEPKHVMALHAESVDGLEFASNGDRLASRSNDGLVIIWSVASGLAEQILWHRTSVTDMCFGSEGEWIATSTSEGDVSVWSTVTGEAVVSFDLPRGNNNSLALSANGCLLAATGGHELVVYDANSFIERASAFAPRSRPGGGLSRTRISANGETITASYVDSWRMPQFVKAWSLRDGRGGLDSKCLPDTLLSAIPLGDGSKVVGACSDGIARFWDASTCQWGIALNGNGRWISDVELSPDQSWVVGISGVVILVWDVDSGEPQATFRGHEAPILGVSFAPEGDRFVTASGDGTSRVWRVDAGRAARVFSLPGEPERLVISPDETSFAVQLRDGTVQVVDSEAGRHLLTLREPEGHVSIAGYVNGGSGLLVARDSSICDASVDVVHAHTGRVESSRVLDVGSLSPNWGMSGTHLFLVGYLDIDVVDLSTGISNRFLEDYQNIYYMRVADGPASEVLVYGDRSETPESILALVDTSANKRTVWTQTFSQWVTAADFSPDGKKTAIGTDDGGAIVSTVDGTLLTVMNMHDHHVTAVSYSPDGSRIACGQYSGDIRIVDAATGLVLLALDGPGSKVKSVHFIRAGNCLVSVHESGVVHIWDSQSMAQRLERLEEAEVAAAVGHQLAEQLVRESADFESAAQAARKGASRDSATDISALRHVMARADAAQQKTAELSRLDSERNWWLSMWGGGRWPTEAEVLLRRCPVRSSEPQALSQAAWDMVKLEAQPNDPVYAFYLARRALALSGDPDDADIVSTYSHALLQLGRFEEAVAGQTRALKQAEEHERGEHEARLGKMVEWIECWHADVVEFESVDRVPRFREVLRQIAEIEADPDVQIWLREKR